MHSLTTAISDLELLCTALHVTLSLCDAPSALCQHWEQPLHSTFERTQPSLLPVYTRLNAAGGHILVVLAPCKLTLRSQRIVIISYSGSNAGGEYSALVLRLSELSPGPFGKEVAQVSAERVRVRCPTAPLRDRTYRIDPTRLRGTVARSHSKRSFSDGNKSRYTERL